MCHSGIAEVALELFAHVAPFLRGMPADVPLIFAGHSLGGSLAKLLWALALLHGHRYGEDGPSCQSMCGGCSLCCTGRAQVQGG